MADDLFDKALGILKDPLTKDVRAVSDKILQRRGAAAYTTPLIPGFDNTVPSDILLLPSRDTYEEQVAAGAMPHYVWESPVAAVKSDALAARRAQRFISKVGTLLGADAARSRPAVGIPSADGTDYDAARLRESRYTQQMTWDSLGSRGESSDSPEPPLTNPSTSWDM